MVPAHNESRDGEMEKTRTQESPTAGGYRLGTRLGLGKHGAVFQARKVEGGEKVVIRFLPLKGRALESARNAAFSRMKIRQPGVIALNEVGIDHRSRLFFVQPYFVGVSLDRILNFLRRHKAPLDGRRFLHAIRAHLDESERGLGDSGFWERDYASIAADLCSQIAKSLDHIHRLGTVHGNLNLSNVFITPFGRALLFNFSLEPKLPSARMDVVNTGRLLRSFYSLTAHQIPTELDYIAFAATASNDADRYHGALALARDLDRFLRKEQIAAKQPTTLVRVVRLLRRRPSRAAAAFFIFSLFASGAVLAWDLISQNRNRANSAKTNAVLSSIPSSIKTPNRPLGLSFPEGPSSLSTSSVSSPK